MTNAQTDRNWDEKYRSGMTPWDSQRPSKELLRVLESTRLAVGTAIELGCGTGTNAVALAARGWEVTAIDCVGLALQQGREKAKQANVHVDWVEADVQNFSSPSAPFDFVFDRGCYHCCRRVDLRGYLTTLRNITAAGGHMLCLCGNPNEAEQGGPPRVREEAVRQEFETLFEILSLHPFYFEDAGGRQGPLGWSVWMRRRAETSSE